MKSIASIFDNSKELLDSITYFVDKYVYSTYLSIKQSIGQFCPLFI